MTTHGDKPSWLTLAWRWLWRPTIDPLDIIPVRCSLVSVSFVILLFYAIGIPVRRALLLLCFCVFYVLCNQCWLWRPTIDPLDIIPVRINFCSCVICCICIGPRFV
jgi:hypothetical protein